MDGREGLIWAFLQAYWYRFLVDCQIYEIERHCGKDKLKIINFLNDVYNIKFHTEI